MWIIFTGIYIVAKHKNTYPRTKPVDRNQSQKPKKTPVVIRGLKGNEHSWLLTNRKSCWAAGIISVITQNLKGKSIWTLRDDN